jgi:hypothetical protein
MELADSIYNSYIFTNEDTIMKGGYRFQKSIRERSAKRSPSIIKGGADENEYNRFENLVIPIGLVLNSYTNLSNDFQAKEFHQDYMMPEIFDRLFDTVVHKSRYQRSKKNKELMKNNITKRLLP